MASPLGWMVLVSIIATIIIAVFYAREPWGPFAIIPCVFIFYWWFKSLGDRF